MDAEVAKFKWMLIALAAFLVSAWLSWGELKYAVWGQSAEALLNSVREGVSSGRRRYPILKVEYQFMEADGTSRIERGERDIGWQIPESGKVSVQYLPGVKHSSRLPGTSAWWAVLIFFGCLGWMSYVLWKLIREANELQYGTGRRRR